MMMRLDQERRLAMTFALRQSLEILQMPQLELAAWLRAEIESNPLLELQETSSSSPLLIDPPAPCTLHQSLSRQIRETLPSSEQAIAAHFLEHLDERGYFIGSLSDIASRFDLPLVEIERIFAALQTFEPRGIFARSLREVLLLQLEPGTLAYQLIQICFEDLLQGRFNLIKKKLGIDDLSFVMQNLSHLNFRPTSLFDHAPVSLALPDLHLIREKNQWILSLYEQDLPKFRIQTEYLNLTPHIPEEKEALRTFRASAKWLCRALSRRRKLLLEIGRFLIRKQSRYLMQTGPLVPLTLKELADNLAIHESTASRAISGKYAETPRGLLPLNSLITATPEAESAKQILQSLIAAEDKRKPLTDEQLVIELQKKGFSLARRTIAKYRTQLHLASANSRKHLR